MIKHLTVLAALLASSLSFAAEYNAHTIKFAATSPKGTPPAIGIELFAKKVNERSGGKIKVRTFPNGVPAGLSRGNRLPSISLGQRVSSITSMR
ncbi:hypothetical protein [Pseudomonas thivervalensis]|uniref:hypothetical protein n=1 Tax=Pseudomonas thivervalensis TaxID=86265 RepID=UPI000F3E1FD7|nr:hypothetical protein ALP39_200258 [Pseudomonas marginalis pv. marginalis]